MAKTDYHKTLEAILEALQKGFKFAFRCLKTLLKYLGVVFIDKIMRAIVLWYDKSHHKNINKEKPCSNTQDDSEVVKKLRIKLQTVQTQLNQKEEHDKIRQSELEQAKQKIQVMTSEVLKLKGIINNHNNETNNYKTQINTLQLEINELRKHSVSPDYIASTILFAEGDACSNNLRKTTFIQMPNSLYEIHTIPGNLSEGTFVVLNPSNVSLVIQNRSVSLKACQIDSVEADSNMLVTLNPGKTQKNGSEWIVTEPAIIKLIKVS